MTTPQTPRRFSRAECLTLILVTAILVTVLLPRCRAKNAQPPAGAAQLSKHGAPIR